MSGNIHKTIPSGERLKLWVRAGGRCQICNRYLLEGDLTGRELTFGQAAHIVGKKASALSPRGLDDDLDPPERNLADNLMLVCDDEHDELDKPGSREAFSVEFLRELKQKHEDRVRLATGFADHHRTTPVRMVGQLRGKSVEVSRETVASAVMLGEGRFPQFDLSTRNMIEIDLRGLPGEAQAGPDYYDAARAKIDEVVDHKLTEAISNEVIHHISVFAFARLPLLVYLGTKLDDTVPVEVYQRHRSTENWHWPDPTSEVKFRIEVPEPARGERDAVLVMNVSGSIQPEELPLMVQYLPRFVITVEGTPFPDVFAGPPALEAFEQTCRSLLGEIERNHKHVDILHVFAAIPLSAGVLFGRVFDPDVHPTIEIYDRAPSGYTSAMRIGKR